MRLCVDMQRRRLYITDIELRVGRSSVRVIVVRVFVTWPCPEAGVKLFICLIIFLTLLRVTLLLHVWKHRVLAASARMLGCPDVASICFFHSER